MTTPILVAVAWPYANADIHVGNLVGSHLPADIFARYHRLKGNRALMVSGTDAHGTPVTLRADADGISPLEVVQIYQQRFLDLFEKLGITFDLFTSTHTANHYRVSQAMFTALNQNGYLYTEIQQQWYSPEEKRFLPDRYVEGTCYLCGYDGARGDQCENCGQVLDATQLIDPRSKTGATALELRETEHFFLDLGKLVPALREYLTNDKDHWRSTVLNQSISALDELRGRPITRDLDWGIPVPVEGWESKCMYVWFEAVIGYLSAAVEWASLSGEPDAWHDWWYNPEARSYYFIGKDNITFHATNWPAQLWGAGQVLADDSKRLNLPYDVPANEFMNLEGRKISGSRNWAVWALDVAERYGPDPVRFYLTLAMPETKDTDWNWADFVRRNNDDLVATWGNLANRMLSFAYKRFDGVVPDPGELRPADTALLETIAAGFDSVGALLEAVKLRAALQEALRLAREVNKYLDQQAPWFEIKQDREAAAKSVYTSLRAIDSLKTLFSPFIPFSSAAVHGYLGYTEPMFGAQYTDTVDQDTEMPHTVLRYTPPEQGSHWQPSELAAGQQLQKPAPLFRKLEDGVVEEEKARLG